MRTPSPLQQRTSTAQLLAAMFRRYWSLPETTPLDTFEKGIREITKAEHTLGDTFARHILITTAHEFFDQHQRCPFCALPDQLHLISPPQLKESTPSSCAPVDPPQPTIQPSLAL